MLVFIIKKSLFNPLPVAAIIRAHFTSFRELKMPRSIMYKNNKQLSEQRERYVYGTKRLGAS